MTGRPDHCLWFVMLLYKKAGRSVSAADRLALLLSKHLSARHTTHSLQRAAQPIAQHVSTSRPMRQIPMSKEIILTDFKQLWKWSVVSLFTQAILIFGAIKNKLLRMNLQTLSTFISSFWYQCKIELYKLNHQLLSQMS